jgi:hypothetical protein
MGATTGSGIPTNAQRGSGPEAEAYTSAVAFDDTLACWQSKTPPRANEAGPRSPNHCSVEEGEVGTTSKDVWRVGGRCHWARKTPAVEADRGQVNRLGSLWLDSRQDVA